MAGGEAGKLSCPLLMAAAVTQLGALKALRTLRDAENARTGAWTGASGHNYSPQRQGEGREEGQGERTGWHGWRATWQTQPTKDTQGLFPLSW